MRAELSLVDVVITERDHDGTERRTRFALPPDIVRVGPAVSQDGVPYVFLYQAIPSVSFDDGRWLRMPLSAT